MLPAGQGLVYPVLFNNASYILVRSCVASVHLVLFHVAEIIINNHVYPFNAQACLSNLWNLPMFTETSIWGDVSKMKDQVPVEYSKLEELFAQKTFTSQNSTSDVKPEDKVIMRRPSTSTEVLTSNCVFSWL